MIDLTNDELLQKTSAARGAAHRSEFAEYSKDHRGHTAIVNHVSAWAVRGDEFVALAEECSRRGLKLPPCDCQADAHDWERPPITTRDEQDG
jgi:hypothetical protein